MATTDHRLAADTSPGESFLPDPPCPVEGPVSGGGWREGTLTRAQELEALSRRAWRTRRLNGPADPLLDDELFLSIAFHLKAAREAATCSPRLRGPRQASLLERARSNLDAAEAQLLNLAPPDYLLGQMPSLLNHVRRHLAGPDPRLREFEHLAERLGLGIPAASPQADSLPPPADKKKEIEEERVQVASIVRGASSAALREQLRVRSFRDVVLGAIIGMSILVIGVAVLGFVSPDTLPMCFQPERSGQTIVVCPTAQAAVGGPATGEPSAAEVDRVIKTTAAPEDLLLVELVGLTAATVAAAAAIRGIRGSSERYGLPVALIALKLPTGALTALLGLLLMRGQFVPGLSALDTSAQILAWALVFGYAQQLLTRLVDQQAHSVLDSVRGKAEPDDRAEARGGSHHAQAP